MDSTELEHNRRNSRTIERAKTGDKSLGPWMQLPGTWKNSDPLDGRGWNLIALPFVEEGQRRNYRLLFNQYNEEFKFLFVDNMVPNRGIQRLPEPKNTDQLIVALDYQQTINQISAKDSANSDLAGDPGLAIHHEPGLFLHMRNRQTDNLNVARLATIPHGNSVTALGRTREFDGPPTIPVISGLPVGVTDDIEIAVEEASDPNSYLFPYHSFVNNPFKGVVSDPNFPGFSPADPNLLLRIGMPNNVVRTIEADMRTDLLEAGIHNIPFVERQADAAFMQSTFWLMELDEPGINGEPKLMLAYSQFIFLDFFQRFDGEPGLIRWPHISINLMEKVAAPEDSEYTY